VIPPVVADAGPLVALTRIGCHRNSFQPCSREIGRELAAGRRALLAAGRGGATILVIDAKNAAVAEWYERLGANRLPERSLLLVMRLELVAEVLGLPYPPDLDSGPVS